MSLGAVVSAAVAARCGSCGSLRGSGSLLRATRSLADAINHTFAFSIRFLIISKPASLVNTPSTSLQYVHLH